ncbi:MAG: hypothetical protein OXI79_08885 [Gammaproteobacteria bacterium]|nr:hypothetical protein [Gammaproteobacteria bacterium]
MSGMWAWYDGEMDGSPLDWTFVELEWLPKWVRAVKGLDAESEMTELLSGLEQLYQATGEGSDPFFVPFGILCK